MQLFMTELAVRDWPLVLAWYREILGLPLILEDHERRFALLGGEGGRLALKEGAADDGHVRLSFVVGDLNATRSRLLVAGEDAGEIRHDAREGFQSFAIVDPEGTPITVFAWADHPETSGNT